MYEFKIPDREGRAVSFKGEKLAQGSSDDGRVNRWSEMEVYRTDSGRYVVHRIGRSSVYHDVSSSCTREAKEVSLDGLAQEVGALELNACRNCHPTDDIVLLEQDRHSVKVIGTSRGLVRDLYAEDGDGVEFLTKLAENVLQRVSRRDKAVREAWLVRTV